MKKNIVILTLGALLSLSSLPAVQAQTSVKASSTDSSAAKYQSIRNEIYRAIERGNEYLKSKQSPEGHWGSPTYPAMSALAVTAMLRSPALDRNKPWPEYVQKGMKIVLDSQKKDGGIYGKGLASYNTSVCMMALLAANKPEYDLPILNARKFLINQQNHFAPDNPYTGGIGYGGEDAPPTADLSNTTLALEALHYSRKLATDGKYGEQPDLDWDAAIQFVSRCQDLPATNDQAWAKGDHDNKGGFAYRPSEEKGGFSATGGGPGGQKGGKSGMGRPQGKGDGNGNGRPDGGKPEAASEQSGKETAQKGTALEANPQKEDGKQQKAPLRTYGSMSYAGLQSLIYAQVKKDDPRITAVVEWLSRNFTLAENPGMNEQGLYYYYQTMSKALSAAGVDELALADGKKVDWRDELTNTIISKQKSDGSWVNTNNRWWEADPVLVTSYMVLALEQLYNSIPVEAPKK